MIERFFMLSLKNYFYTVTSGILMTVNLYSSEAYSHTKWFPCTNNFCTLCNDYKYVLKIL